MNTFAEYEAQEWEFNGMSALTLYRVHQGRAPTRGHHPHDPDDYCRVRQMLRMLFGDNEAAKRSLIQTTADYYDDEVWRRIAAHYDDFMVL